jgi:Tol biopolymer transport system component
MDMSSFSLSQAHKRLIYASLRTEAVIWSIAVSAGGSIPISQSSSLFRADQPIEGVSVSPDRQWLLFDFEERGEGSGLYRIPLKGGEAQQLTIENGPWAPGGWSRDSKVFAASLRKEGNVDIYLMTPDGEVRERVTREPGEEIGASISADGNMVLYASASEGQNHVYLIQREGAAWSRPTQLVQEPSSSPRWSPTANVFAYVATGEIRIQNLKGEKRVLDRVHPPDRFNGLEWSSDGRMIYYKRFDGSGRGGFWMAPFAGGKPRQIVVSKNATDSPTQYSFAANGTSLFFTTSTSKADIWTAELLRR